MIQQKETPFPCPESFMRKRKQFIFLQLALFIAVLLSILAAVSLGAVSIPLSNVLSILFHKVPAILPVTQVEPSPLQADIIWELRLPRVLMAAIAGAGLALSGTVMQACVQNPLAEPYLLGISSGASLGAAFSILMNNFFQIPGNIILWAFLGALTASGLVLLLAGAGGRLSTIKIVLAGTVANAFFLSLTNFLIYISNNLDGMRSITFWTMGSLASAKWEQLLAPALGIVICGVYFLSQPRILNSLLVGEEAAITLGIQLNKVRRNYMVISALMTALIVSTCGIFGFVGLIIPHIVRGTLGADHQKTVPAALLLGAVFLIWADLAARTILPNGELPIGIITSLIGAPFFMYILCKKNFAFGTR